MKQNPEIWKWGDHHEMASDDKKYREMDPNLLKSQAHTQVHPRGNSASLGLPWQRGAHTRADLLDTPQLKPLP